MCTHVHVSLSVAHGGHSNIFYHISTKKHKNCFAAKASSRNLTEYQMDKTEQ